MESSKLVVSKLSEAKTKKAFESCDWAGFQSHLDEIGLDEPTFEELLGHLRRSSGFVIRYPNHKQELKRNRFRLDLAL
jgi:hypothetical protein